MPLAYPRILIATGEHSGDLFGARLARALRDLAPNVRLSGLGGPEMAAAGVRIAADTTAHAGMGVLHPLLNAFQWARVYRRAIAEFNGDRPDALVPVDNPGFNLKLASAARERGIPVCYYVSPQVWAWRPGRIHRIARLVDRMMCILPFEKPLYDCIGADCRYVGHPLLDYMAERPLDKAFIATLGTGGKTVVGILPGSRSQEIADTFPIIADAARRLRERLPGVAFHVAAAAKGHVPAIRAILDERGLRPAIHLGKTREIMSASRLCIAVSGTATLETAYYRTPMVVVYRAGAFARHIVPHLIEAPHICLVNIIAGRQAVPEFLQFDDDPRPATKAALALLTDEAAWQTCRERLDAVMKALGPPGSTRRAAEAVLDCMERGRTGFC